MESGDLSESLLQEAGEGCPNLTMVDWFQKAQQGAGCAPCALAPVGQWYYQALIENGFEGLAKELEEVATAGDTEAIVTLFDAIKNRVPDALLEDLKGFDCALQTTDLAEFDAALEAEDEEHAEH